ncbi:ABC transporter substrate-binding protein [Bdellovibrionota bacterium FG-1]
MKEIRTYLAFTFPVDPVKMDTIAEMELSYALASTLVEWDENKQVRAAIAESWHATLDQTIVFTLRKETKWSDGNPITSEQIKRSFERALKTHPEDLRSLTNLLEAANPIQALSLHQLAFRLKKSATQGDLLKKLTEPNFGILKIRENGGLDLSVTSGAFFLKAAGEKELILDSNPHWHRHQADVPDRVIARRPKPDAPEGSDQTVLLYDPWPNLIETSSLINTDVLQKYKADGFSLWERPIDKVFLLFLARKRANPDHFSLLRFLRSKLNRQTLTSNLTGFSLGDQIFPMGYALHDSHDSDVSKAQFPTDPVALPEYFKHHPIEVMASQGRITPQLKENLRQSLLAATGIEPKFTWIQKQDAGKHKRAGDFDVYVAMMGLADPDPEGVMSYYFEGETPVVPSSKEDDFVARLDHARKDSDPQERIQLMRNIATDAVRKGHVLPLFHLSTFGVGRPELDFSQVPTSEESVTFSKIRFRDSRKAAQVTTTP